MEPRLLLCIIESPAKRVVLLQEAHGTSSSSATAEKEDRVAVVAMSYFASSPGQSLVSRKRMVLSFAALVPIGGAGGVSVVVVMNSRSTGG